MRPWARRRRAHPFAAALLIAAAALLPAAASAAGPPAAGFELSRSVSQSLLHLQEVWLQWISAFYQGDRAAAAAQVAELKTSLARLGFTRLPELSMGATVRAIEAARQGDLKRAQWALDDAEALDPGRPETAFGRALTAWEGKHYPRAVEQQLVGYARLFALTPNDELVTQNLLLAALAVALLAGAGFVLVQLAAKGSRLYWSISSRLAMLPSPLAHLLTIVLLLWPLLTPGGILWALLYWSVLLWAFSTLSERLVLAVLWMLLAVTPLALQRQHQKIALLLTPPVRAVAALNEGRLYGALFTDLGLLPSMLPDSVAVRQMLGDLHRLLGQWDEARIYYAQVLEKEPQNVDALIDVGAYHFLTGDHGGAVQFFQRAATADPNSAAAYYNLSQAYSDAYQFAEQHEALARARLLDEARVNRWIQQSSGDRVITFNGGLARHEEVLGHLQRSMQAPPTSAKALNVRRWLPLGISLTALVLALALQRVLPREDSPPPPKLVNRPGRLAMLMRVALPGIPSAEGGNGGRAYLALLVVALALVLLGGSRLIYPLPLGLQPGAAAPTAAAASLLVIFFASRVWADLH
ncbi:MAG TPA: tetratricopeptide repeat protein [Thermoanaerobaculia bacterium]|nr:tetratricopeptide repeat protein [Thermoanaerobaculia bacterium]